ncbi:hypothetical protein [Xenorhabdus sp. IM139775]|uniref:hypothetical protein n=1 Tax=Xenorhabdus sp. IM139775 TaxID=3025876 RepID=UPI002359D6BB|nr:hypothetical protein [Xenorhabdus sp. IM139775]MDC9594974.1 hypothetical protein [Xenorhabdus sp. IM139775]
MRYICALLEADIAGHITHRPAMKVYRSYAPAYHPLPAEWYLPRSDQYNTVLIGTTFTDMLIHE